MKPSDIDAVIHGIAPVLQRQAKEHRDLADRVSVVESRHADQSQASLAPLVSECVEKMFSDFLALVRDGVRAERRALSDALAAGGASG
jgi:hypothetical protein